MVCVMSSNYYTHLAVVSDAILCYTVRMTAKGDANMPSKKSPNRLTVLDEDRVLRDQAEALALKRIYGTNISDVIRSLVALAYLEHYGDRAPADVLGRVE